MDWSGDRLQIPLWDWMEVFEKEYVADYLKAGGSTVKFLSASDATLNTALDAVRDTAGHYGYHFVHIDPSKPNEIGKKQAFHRIDELYFELIKVSRLESMGQRRGTCVSEVSWHQCSQRPQLKRYRWNCRG
jgi:hypothetical protein